MHALWDTFPTQRFLEHLHIEDLTEGRSTLPFCAAALPAQVDRLGLELCLRGFSERIDLGITAASSTSRDAFANWADTWSAERRSTWVCRSSWTWPDRDSPSGAIFCELDEEQPETATPSVFFGLALPSICSPPDVRASWGALASKLVEPSHEVFSTGLIEELLAPAPDDFRLDTIGFMGSHRIERLRCCVAVPLGVSVRYLRSLGISRSRAFERFLPLTEDFGWVHLAVGASEYGIVDRFGVEVVSTPGLLERIRAEGLASDAVLHRLRRWLAESSRSKPFSRTLNHLKLTFYGDEISSVKAYVVLKPGM